jgi:hypothetical protein
MITSPVYSASVRSTVLSLKSNYVSHPVPAHVRWIGYKEARQGSSNAFKVNAYYDTEWMTEDALPLRLEGLTLDAVYESFVRQVAGEQLAEAGTAESLRDAVEKADRRRKLEKQITILEKKMQTEKQFNRQLLIKAQIQQLIEENNL